MLPFEDRERVAGYSKTPFALPPHQLRRLPANSRSLVADSVLPPAKTPNRSCLDRFRIKSTHRQLLNLLLVFVGVSDSLCCSLIAGEEVLLDLLHALSQCHVVLRLQILRVADLAFQVDDDVAKSFVFLLQPHYRLVVFFVQNCRHVGQPSRRVDGPSERKSGSVWLILSMAA